MGTRLVGAARQAAAGNYSGTVTQSAPYAFPSWFDWETWTLLPLRSPIMQQPADLDWTQDISFTCGAVGQGHAGAPDRASAAATNVRRAAGFKARRPAHVVRRQVQTKIQRRIVRSGRCAPPGRSLRSDHEAAEIGGIMHIMIARKSHVRHPRSPAITILAVVVAIALILLLSAQLPMTPPVTTRAHADGVGEASARPADVPKNRSPAFLAFVRGDARTAPPTAAQAPARKSAHTPWLTGAADQYTPVTSRHPSPSPDWAAEGAGAVLTAEDHHVRLLGRALAVPCDVHHKLGRMAANRAMVARGYPHRRPGQSLGIG